MDEHKQHNVHDHSEHGQQQEDHSQHDAGDHAANNAVVEKKPESYVIQGDPTEAALLVAAQKASLNTSRFNSGFEELERCPSPQIVK